MIYLKLRLYHNIFLKFYIIIGNCEIRSAEDNYYFININTNESANLMLKFQIELLSNMSQYR